LVDRPHRVALVNALSSLGVAATIVIGTVVFAVGSMRRITMTPEEYMVAGRGLGSVFLWVLLAGEIYTSFTFLGAAGYTYSLGAPAFYIMAYGACGYIFYYFVLPWVWRMGKTHGLLTFPDLIQHRYANRTLTTVSTIVLVLAAIPYITLQLSALQTFLEVAGNNAINPVGGAVTAYLLIVAFVFATGLRGTAWASIIKDALVLGALIFVGIAIPVQFFGSPATLFDQLLRAHPAMLVLGPPASPHGTLWFISTVLLTGLGFFCGLHSISAVYSARSENAIRRNAMLLPLYQLAIMLVFFAGFSALLIVPNLKGTQADRSFLLLVAHYYPAWVLGFITAAGALCALVPSTALLLASSSAISKNILGDLFHIGLDDVRRVRTTRITVAVLGLLALVMWLFYHALLVDLLLLVYNGISQFVPALFLGVAWKRTSSVGIFAGLLVGLTVALTCAVRGVAPLGLNPGFIGLACNAAVVVAITLIAPAHTEQTLPEGAVRISG
jgi:SSS family solute:Na+ symporter